MVSKMWADEGISPYMLRRKIGSSRTPPSGQREAFDLNQARRWWR